MLVRRKHVQQMESQGLQNPHARLFSNPAGDYGSMVNERVGTSDWESASELGDTWASRYAFSYGWSGSVRLLLFHVGRALLLCAAHASSGISGMGIGVSGSLLSSMNVYVTLCMGLQPDS